MDLDRSWLYKDLPKLLETEYGPANADILWHDICETTEDLLSIHREELSEYAEYIYPAAAVWQTLSAKGAAHAKKVMQKYGTSQGEKRAKLAGVLKAVPGGKMLCKHILPVSFLSEKDKAREVRDALAKLNAEPVFGLFSEMDTVCAGVLGNG